MMFFIYVFGFIVLVLHEAHSSAPFATHKHRHLNTTMDLLMPLLKAASYVAESSQAPRPKGSSIFDYEGHIFDVLDEVRYYMQAANLPEVTTICEIGFNAGHSSIVFLASNPNAILYSFDLGNLPWTAKSVEFISYLFPGRFQYIKGRSVDIVKEDSLPKGVKCDLLSVDGDHRIAYVDIKNGLSVVRPHAYVLADDYADGYDVIRDWKKAEEEQMIKTVDCHPNAFHVKTGGGYYKGWCLGQYV
jgi:hypothetical protein